MDKSWRERMWARVEATMAWLGFTFITRWGAFERGYRRPYARMARRLGGWVFGFVNDPSGSGDGGLAQEPGVLEVECLPGGGPGLVPVLFRLLDGLTFSGAIASFAHG